jgi:hypothetical protein
MQIYDRAKRIVVGGVLTAILILGGCGPTKADRRLAIPQKSPL